MTKSFITATALMTLLAFPALACNGGGNCENAPGHNKSSEGGERGKHQEGGGGGGAVKGAPGPIAGAGLPVLAIGYGVYWLVKRRRHKLNS